MMRSYLGLIHPTQQAQQRVSGGDSVALQQSYLMPNVMSGAVSPQLNNHTFWIEKLASISVRNNLTSPFDVGNRHIVGDDPSTNLTCHSGNRHFFENKESVNPSCYSRQDHQMIIRNVSPTHHLQNSMVSAVRADHMTVEQTATWMRTFASSNCWQEADWYAWSFQENSICGYLLPKLTLDSLKTDLGILKYGHRLEIMAAIKCLFPGMTIRDGGVKNMIENVNQRSPMSVTTPEAQSHGMDASPLHTHLSSCTIQKTKNDWVSTQSQMSPKESKPCHPISPNTNEQLKEVDKWFTQTTGKRPPPITKLPDIIFEKSSRASPGNPLAYVALCKVKIRSGKSMHSDHIRNIRKGTVVVINQIKGRCGRVVLHHENGEFEKVGWVTLHTHDKQQLLQRHTHKTDVPFERKMK